MDTDSQEVCFEALKCKWRVSEAEVGEVLPVMSKGIFEIPIIKPP